VAGGKGMRRAGPETLDSVRAFRSVDAAETGAAPAKVAAVSARVADGQGTLRPFHVRGKQAELLHDPRAFTGRARDDRVGSHEQLE